MTNIVRRDPYAIDNMLDDLFKGFFVRPMRYSGEMPEMSMVKMDIKDIHVTIDGNTVSINAEVKKTSEEKEGDKVLRSERYYGKVSRSFSLAQDVDEAGAKAKFDKGVLELVLPKKAMAATKKLSIE